MTTRLLSNALHFSEFQGGYHGTCGETALATAMVCASPQIEDTPTAINLMLAMTRELISLGWASASGATTTQHLRDEASKRGFASDAASFIGYQQPLNLDTLHTLLLGTAGIKPIIVEVARAGVLPGDEIGVQYHFICIVGITDTGYICNDGDNANISQHLITYSWQQLQAAVPCGVLVLDMEQTPSMWTRLNGGGAQDNAGHHVGAGLAGEIFAQNLQGTSGLNSETYISAKQSLVALDNGVVVSWDGSAHIDQAAQIVVGLLAQIDGLNQQISTLKAAQNPPLDPSVRQALSAALQVVQPQVSLAADLQAALTKLPN